MSSPAIEDADRPLVVSMQKRSRSIRRFATATGIAAIIVAVLAWSVTLHSPTPATAGITRPESNTDGCGTPRHWLEDSVCQRSGLAALGPSSLAPMPPPPAPDPSQTSQIPTATSHTPTATATPRSTQAPATPVSFPPSASASPSPTPVVTPSPAPTPVIFLSANVMAETVTMSVNVSGTGPSAVGGLVGAVLFDASQLTPVACSEVFGPCNLSFGAGDVRFAVLSTDELSGVVTSVTFTIARTVSGLVSVGLAIDQCADSIGLSRMDCTGAGTAFTVIAPSPIPTVVLPAHETPTPSPLAPLPAHQTPRPDPPVVLVEYPFAPMVLPAQHQPPRPTPTPLALAAAALPRTGGSFVDSAIDPSNAASWILVLAGFIAALSATALLGMRDRE